MTRPFSSYVVHLKGFSPRYKSTIILIKMEKLLVINVVDIGM
jgi:hypothetical protein